MKLFYYKDTHGNYGDDLNGWLWPRLFPNTFTEESDTLFCGIGTILGEAQLPAVPKHKLVMGSGVGYAKPPVGFGDKNWTVVCVRGPLSAKVLNLTEDMAVTDGAILLASFPEFKPLLPSEREGILFMPHHGNACKLGRWKEVCDKIGITFVDPRDESVETTQKIRHAKLVVAEAMHAAIVADAMRVPWIPVYTSANINYFKWMDWTLSLKMAFKPLSLPATCLLEMLGNLRIKVMGEVYTLPEASEKAALELARRRFMDKESPINYRVEYAVTRRLLYLNEQRWYHWLARPLDAFLFHRAAKALKKIVSNATSFLSAQDVYEERLSEMLKRVEVVKAFKKDA